MKALFYPRCACVRGVGIHSVAGLAVWQASQCGSLTVWQASQCDNVASTVEQVHPSSPQTLSYEGGGYGLAHLGLHK